MVQITDQASHPDQASKLPNKTATSNDPTPTTYPNLLTKYSSFTYNIALQATTRSNYNLMLELQKYDPSQWTTIIHSGGVGGTRAHRPETPPAGYIGANANATVNSVNVTTQPAGTTQFFTSDLYIDDLNLGVQLGNNSVTRGSNATDISFKIVEPYGMDFLENLSDFVHSADGLNEDNYTDLPFLLVLNFYGYTEDGIASQVAGATKYIPIHLSDMKVKLDTTGATYDVTAVPYNELGNSEAFGRALSQIEVSDADLKSMVVQFADSLNKDQASYVSKGNQQFPDTYKIVMVPQTNPTVGLIDIGASRLSKASSNPSNNVPMKKSESSSSTPGTITVDVVAKARNISKYQSMSTVEAAQQQAGSVISFNSNNVSIPAGKSILEALNAMIIGSEYIANQITEYQQKTQKVAQQIQDAEKDWLSALKEYNDAATEFNKKYSGISVKDTTQTSTSLNNKMQNLFQKQADLRRTAQPKVNEIWQQYSSSLQYPLKWFKIAPEVQIGNYDLKRNTYQKNITFYVSPYLVFGSYSDNAPKISPVDHVVKSYDYIFTGNNTEILKFDLEFSSAFQVYKQINSETKGLGTGGKVPNAPIVSADGLSLIPAQNAMNQGQFIAMVPDNPDNPASTGQMTPERCAAGDLASTVYSPSDLLSLEITIMGDPDYIHQDSIFLRPTATMSAYELASSGSPQGIRFDNGEVYFQMNFKVPQDYNLDSGRAETVTNSSTSTVQRKNIFQGYYRVLTVTNKFSGGTFTQDIKAVKWYPSADPNAAPTAV